MRRIVVATALACALLEACAGGRERLVSSFDHSEWHPWSTLTLDMPTGGFTAKFWDGTHANGRFSTGEMQQIATRLAEARKAGFDDPTCGEATEGYRRIVISNGGQKTLELRGPAPLTAPSGMGCWTPEAEALHASISRILAARGDDWTMPRRRPPPGRVG